MTKSSKTQFVTNEFLGSRVLVTVGTKGAGKAIADRFAAGGATVIVTTSPRQKRKQTFILSGQMSQLPKTLQK